MNRLAALGRDPRGMRFHRAWRALGLTAVSVWVLRALPLEAAENFHLRPLHAEGQEYRTPRAGEGFRTEVLGRQVEVEPRDRRSISAWDAGVAAVTPGIAGSEALPFGSIYLWRHPDEDFLFRAILLGLYDEVVLARSWKPLRPFEVLLNFENYTIPMARAESVDGVRIQAEELYWGYVRPAVGFGYRQQYEEPGADDNMFSLSLLAEPGFLFFDGGHNTAANFVEPRDAFEGCLRLAMRLDKLERNLLELPHEGFALGADGVYGHRTPWNDWGEDAREDAASGRSYVFATAYALGAWGLPFLRDERHRILVSFHGGIGDRQDRFSRMRVGGGPTGEEYHALDRPVIPGAAIEEFATDRYAVLVGEYRWEPIFFTYVGIRSSLAYMRRERFHGGAIDENDDLLASVGLRITTGFVLETRIQVDYNYSAGVVRRGEFGGHEIVAHISRSF